MRAPQGYVKEGMAYTPGGIPRTGRGWYDVLLDGVSVLAFTHSTVADYADEPHDLPDILRKVVGSHEEIAVHAANGQRLDADSREPDEWRSLMDRLTFVPRG